MLVCFIFSNGSQFLSSKYSLLEDVLPHHKVVSSNATTRLQQRIEKHHCLGNLLELSICVKTYILAEIARGYK